MHQIVLYSLKRMGIERDQIFLQLHDVVLIELIEQQIWFLLALMREVDYTEVKLNLPRDVGHNDPYNLILISINNKLHPMLCWIWN
jgi:hypothetical protein